MSDYMDRRSEEWAEATAFVWKALDAIYASEHLFDEDAEEIIAQAQASWEPIGDGES